MNDPQAELLTKEEHHKANVAALEERLAKAPHNDGYRKRLAKALKDYIAFRKTKEKTHE